MKFKSPENEPISIALTSGHTAIVPPEGAELDPMFHREAIAQGCIPDTGATGSPVLQAAQFNRALVIGEAMEAMIAGKDASDFTSDGKPDLRKLKGRVGFGVSREESDAIWAEVSKDQTAEA